MKNLLENALLNIACSRLNEYGANNTGLLARVASWIVWHCFVWAEVIHGPRVSNVTNIDDFDY